MNSGLDGIETASGITFYSQVLDADTELLFEQEMRYLYPDSGHQWAGWILAKHPDGGWYSFRRATNADIEELNAAVVKAHHQAEKEESE